MEDISERPTAVTNLGTVTTGAIGFVASVFAITVPWWEFLDKTISTLGGVTGLIVALLTVRKLIRENKNKE
jgi:hypothetical protein